MANQLEDPEDTRATARFSTAPHAWVAIDVAKRTHVVLVEFSDGKRRHYRVQRGLADIDRFVAFLHDQEAPVRVGFKPTSNYRRALAYRLNREGFELRLISSVADIAYVPTSAGFLFLTVVLDAWRHRIADWTSARYSRTISQGRI